MSDHTTVSLAAKLAVAKAKLEVLKASFGTINRFPAGSSKGGQFAPKGGAGVTAPQLGLGGNTFVESGWAGSGMWSKPKTPPPGAKPHPQKDDKGNAVSIDYPTPASPASTWSNPKAVATFTPNGKTPEVLNGVPFKSWAPPKAGWAAVKGTNEKLDQDFPFEPHPTKKTGAGVIILEPDGRVWLTKPTNEFGNYKQTFPKGTAESGLTLQQNAIKEAWEETGLKVKIIGIAADIERDTSKARFYFARRVGGTPKDMGWESQALRLAPRKQALDLLNRTHDKQLLADVLDEMGIRKAKGDAKESGKPGAWQFQERWPAGSSLGGQWKAMGADGITAPPKIAGGLAGSNSAYQKAANAAHDAAQKGDLTAMSAVLDKYEQASLKFASGAKASSHVKWGAQVHQYVTQAKADVKAKTSATATADKLQGPQKLSAMKYEGGKPGGSNPGGMYSDAEGKWLVKGSNAGVYAGGDATTLRSQNEVLASKLMHAVGAGAPDMKLVDLEGKYGGGTGVASKWVTGGVAFDAKNPAHLAAAQADFAVHAWLANYDVLGLSLDNTQIVNGKAVNIDPGGALLYRAQGEPKGDKFTTKATEFDTLRDASINPNGAKVYGAMTASQLAASAEKLKAIDDDTIIKLVQTYGPGDDVGKGVLAAKLITRKADILARVAALNPPVASTPKPAPASAPAPAVAPAAATVKVSERVYHNTEGNHNKFWAYSVHGDKLITRYGKIGTEGSITVKQFSTPADAIKAGFDLKAQKLAKGYSFKGEGAPHSKVMAALGEPAAPPRAPKAAPPTAPAAPATPVAKPTSWPFAGKANYYNSLADKAEKLHAAGDLVGLKVLQYKNSVGGAAAWPAGSLNGKIMGAYHSALVADLEKKQAAQAMATVQAAQAAVSKPVTPPAKGTALNGAPMPDFAKFKLPATNSNAPSHNAKVDTIANLANKGDVKGLLSLNYGTNNYAKKQVQLANDALAALGSPFAVTAGQKANTHLALTGGVPSATVAAAAATTKSAAPAKHPATMQQDHSKLDVSKAVMPEPPEKFTASSKAWVNDQNNQLATGITALGNSGNLTALQSMTYEVIDKESGSKTGVHKPVGQHPSKGITGYYEAVKQTLHDVAHPPRPLKTFDVTQSNSIASITSAMPGHKLGMIASKVAKNEQIGFFMALGKVADVTAVAPKNVVPITTQDIQAGKTKYKSMSSTARAFISGVQGNSLPGQYRQGIPDGPAGDSLRSMAHAALAAATTKPAGTVLYKNIDMSSDMVNKLLAAGPGTVLQCDSPMCTTYVKDNPSTKHFGKHMIEFVYAPGAKAIDSHGSGKYSSEKEITILPMARFVLMSAAYEKDPNGGGQRLKARVLLLPPDPPGYV